MCVYLFYANTYTEQWRKWNWKMQIEAIEIKNDFLKDSLYWKPLPTSKLKFLVIQCSAKLRSRIYGHFMKVKILYNSLFNW